MNISIVVPYFTPYVHGNEYGLAKTLARLGHKVTIVTSTARAPRENMVNITETEAIGLNFKVEYLPTFLDIGDNPLTTGIAEGIRDQNLVMLQEDYPFICHSAFSAAKKYNIATILSSERTYYPESILKRYALKVQDARTNKKLRNGVDMLTTHCTAAKEFMINELDVRREIKVIHVGIDTELFKPMQQQGKYCTEGDFKILTIARLHRYKGLKYLIEAMKRIEEEIPNAHLYIIGKGAEERNLKNLTSRLKLNNVTFLATPIPNYKMPELYAECDVYAQPSIEEPYGIAVLEAMACGKPVIGTNVGGMKDTINKETGFLAEPENSVEIANYIKLLYDEKTRKRMSVNARKRAVDEFEWSRIAAKYMEMLEEKMDI